MHGICDLCRSELEQHRRIPSMPARDPMNMATQRVWCPTWLGSERGPLEVCDEHAEHFRSFHGSWHWGDEADRVYRGVKNNIPYTGARFQNARGMVLNGSRLTSLGTLYDKNSGLYIVDGDTWLLTDYNVLNLGDRRTARETFPVLFAVSL